MQIGRWLRRMTGWDDLSAAMPQICDALSKHDGRILRIVIVSIYATTWGMAGCTVPYYLDRTGWSPAPAPFSHTMAVILLCLCSVAVYAGVGASAAWYLLKRGFAARRTRRAVWCLAGALGFIAPLLWSICADLSIAEPHEAMKNLPATVIMGTFGAGIGALSWSVADANTARRTAECK